MHRRYDCKTVLDMLPLHVGDDLDPKHVDGVDRHLSSCLSCFRAFREHVGMRGRLHVLADEPLPAGILDGFTDEVMARIEVGEPGPAAEAPTPGPRVLVLPRMAAAAAMLLVALAGWRLFDDGGSRLPERAGVASDFAGEVSTAPSGPRLPATVTPGYVPLAPGGALPVGVSPHALIDPEAPSPSTLDLMLLQRGGTPMRVFLIQAQAPAANGLKRDQAEREPRQRER